MDVGRRALIVAALLVALPAGAATFRLPGTACADFALERRGNDLAITCPGPWSYYTASKRTTFATLRDWYLLCGYHVAMRTQAGATVMCTAPIRRRP